MNEKSPGIFFWNSVDAVLRNHVIKISKFTMKSWYLGNLRQIRKCVTKNSAVFDLFCAGQLRKLHENNFATFGNVAAVLNEIINDWKLAAHMIFRIYSEFAKKTVLRIRIKNSRWNAHFRMLNMQAYFLESNRN